MIAPYHIEPANCQQRTGIDTASEGGETVAINGGWHEWPKNPSPIKNRSEIFRRGGGDAGRRFRRSLFLASTTAVPVAAICYAADLMMISSEGP
ncbi:hypothetical protein YC2023_091277 [Brassica napus]